MNYELLNNIVDYIEENSHNWWIYTYSLKGNKKLWDNRYIGLSEHYDKLK